MKSYMKFGEQIGDGAIEETVVLLDLSPSMDDDDIYPSRLEAAGVAAGALINVKADGNPRDRVGIVGFSAGAKVIHRMATVGSARNSLQAALDRVATSSCTNISAGLREACGMLGRQSAGDLVPGFLRKLFNKDDSGTRTPPSAITRRILLLSDGAANRGGSPVAVARQLKDGGIIIDVIGVGTNQRDGDFDEPELRSIASKNRDGTRRYCFINEASALVRKFEKLAQHIRPLEA